MDYILGPKPDSCVLCLPPDDLSHDEERLVLYRGKAAFVIMNKFPYNNGHIMVALYNYSNYIFTLHPGDRIAQGILMPYAIATNGNDNATQRTGGIGSTGN